MLVFQPCECEVEPDRLAGDVAIIYFKLQAPMCSDSDANASPDAGAPEIQTDEMVGLERWHSRRCAMTLGMTRSLYDRRPELFFGNASSFSNRIKSHFASEMDCIDDRSRLSGNVSATTSVGTGPLILSDRTCGVPSDARPQLP
jgi:hypothetical protein